MGATGTRPGGLTLTTQQWAWVFVVLFFVLGDVVTTSVGLSMAGIAERNEVLKPVIENSGMAGMVGLKAVIVGGGYLLTRALPRPQKFAIPAGLLIVGVSVSVWNLVVVSRVLLA